jgi:hypothetical protein
MRLVRERLLELATQNHEIEICNQAALDGALMLMEEEDGHQSR